MVDNNFMKRVAHFLVLEILKAHTDEEHGLKVTEIVELLKKDYEVEFERKAVSRILSDLYELSELPGDYDWKNPMNFSIKFDVIPRRNGDIRENWRLCKEFEDAEVRLLMDLLKSVPGYPNSRLYTKLQRLGTTTRKHGHQMVASHLINKQMPVTIGCIEQAIRNEWKLSFHYCLAPNAETGERPVYTASPYMTAFREGNYYLVCFDETKNEMDCFRIDRIFDAQLIDKPAKDYHAVCNKSLDAYLREYIAARKD